MISHVFDRGILIIRFPSGIDVAGRAAVAVETEHLIHARRPLHVVIQLALPEAVAPAVFSLVLRAHRLCTEVGASSAIVSASSDVRRLLAANADSSGPAVFADLSDAVRQALQGHELAS
ncbi:hypothetical protein [Streptomyces sp. NPDC046161]|uniref:hypothetical protein n=1 Tax=Streptomyces sp. NPDC046161 TaxID=3155132 RepID=UPI0033FF77B5